MDERNKAIQKQKNLIRLSKSNDNDVRLLFEMLVNGDIKALAKAITICESETNEDKKKAIELLALAKNINRESIRLGVSGIPGVGKSTFIESLGLVLLQEGKRVAVLSIDPTSNKSKGSILGDKTRMENLSKHKNSFVRPSPSALSLGGTANNTYEALLLCEAAGYDYIIVETVGVGQSEVEVKFMTDLFILLMVPGTGDELQGIKKGIMEMADIIVLNKIDLLPKSLINKKILDLKKSLKYKSKNESINETEIVECSSINVEGFDKIKDVIDKNIKFSINNNTFYKLREKQSKYWLRKSIVRTLNSKLNNILEFDEIKELIDKSYNQDIDFNYLYSKVARYLISEL